MSERLTRDEEAALRKAWAAVGDWEQTTPEEEHECPVCGGDGYVDGVRYDATAACAATVVGYGIGDGLEAAELLAVSTGPLLATLDAERAKVARLREALEHWQRACHPHPVEHPAMTAAWKHAAKVLAETECEP